MLLSKIQIVQGRVDSKLVVSELCNPSHGGQSLFFGVVRNLNHGREVKAVSYECHRALAERALNEIVSEARAKVCEDLDIYVAHGVGRLEVGEVSVAIGVSSRHRDEAFQACRYIIEQIKVRVPIWKQEHYIDGDSEWLQGHELCRHSP